MKKLLAAAAALFFSTVALVPAVAQSTTTVDAVMGVCTVVIDDQYHGKHDRDGQCIAAVQSYLTAIAAKSEKADPLISTLILELVKLYRFDAKCLIGDTELPEAISLASSMTFDKDVAAEYLAISQQINVCDFEATAAIDDELATGA